MAMSKFEPKYFDAGATIGAIDHADHVIAGQAISHVPSLRYSPPWPWILALTISMTLWAFLVWLIWVLVR